MGVWLLDYTMEDDEEHGGGGGGDSEHESEGVDGGDGGDDDDLSSVGEQSIGMYIERVYKYLGHDRPVALDEHRKAVVSLRKACLSNQLPDGNSISRLIFTLMALLRRVILIRGVVSDYEHSIMIDDEEVVETRSFQRTLTLTFLLIARVEALAISAIHSWWGKM